MSGIGWPKRRALSRGGNSRRNPEPCLQRVRFGKLGNSHAAYLASALPERCWLRMVTESAVRR
jgi:hypothetical protein